MPRFRRLRLGAFALSIALVMLLGAALPSHPTQPLGEVLGVVARPAAPLAPPLHDPRFVYARAKDRPVPLASLERVAPAPEELTGYAWPLLRGRLTLPFKAIPGGSRIKDGKLFHDGIDVASFCGDTVRAAHDGVVLAAGRQFDHVVGWVGDLGPYYRVLDKKKLWDDLPLVVVINDGNGYRSVYAHFSKVTVAVGDRVKAGQKIGLEGMTGHASGCHVHYGLFSPFETDTFGVRADILKKLRLPEAEIARIDPLIVMPDGAEALKTRRIPVPSAATTPPTESQVSRN